MAKPNILLVTMDQLSLHALSCYESNLCRTPAIDALARDGVTFERAYSPCALCTPARASMLTGVYPHTHGALHNSGVIQPFTEDQVRGERRLFSEALLEAGYRIGYQGKWHTGLTRTAADAGFEGFGPAGYGHYKESESFAGYLAQHNLKEVEEIIEYYAQSKENWLDTVGYLRGRIEATGEYFLAEETMRQIREFSKGPNPWFQWLSFWGPHAPYWPHEQYLELYDPKSIRMWNSFREAPENKPYAHERYRRTVFPDPANADWDKWSWIISRYYALTTMIDDQIARVVEFLKERDLYDDTMIIFLADHGDSLGIHGGVFDKGAMAYEQIYHVPLVVKPPGSERPGERLDNFVSLLDVTATIVDSAAADMSAMHGRSLTPLLDGDVLDWRDTMYAEFYGHRFPIAQRILWWDNYKFVLNFADRDELYDLANDVEEIHNLIDDADCASVARKMRELMVAEFDRYDDTLHPQARRLLEYS